MPGTPSTVIFENSKPFISILEQIMFFSAELWKLQALGHDFQLLIVDKVPCQKELKGSAEQAELGNNHSVVEITQV